MGAASSASVRPVCPQPGGTLAPPTARGKPRASDSSQSSEECPDGFVKAGSGRVLAGLDELLEQNRKWAVDRVTEDPAYFSRLQNIQTPQWLWIGCADSRVPANVIMGLQPGEVFVQRNVGNQATHTDMNVMACLEYAVKQLKVKSIICCGHYGCGAVHAALRLPSKTQGIVNCWISDIRECRNQHHDELQLLPVTQQVDRLCELNVIRQCFHLCTSPVVQGAWDAGQELSVYGLIYGLRDGLIHKLVGPLTKDNAGSELQEYSSSHGNSKMGSQKGGWAPVKRFSMGCDHGAHCDCDGGPVQDAAFRTADLASKIAAHTAWSRPAKY